jgi:enterochelin esterase-like enzyme
LRELIREVESAYKISVPGQPYVGGVLAGLSMGGKQALDFGLTHPDSFSAVGNFSGAIHSVLIMLMPTAIPTFG